MRTSAMLPMGVNGKVNTEMVSKGDILELADGMKVAFIEMKRVKFIGKDQASGKNYQIPIWRDRFQTTPFVAKNTGKKDKALFANVVKKTNLKYGDLFSLDGKKETFMFLENTTKRDGRPAMKAINLASSDTYTIGEGFTLKKINLAKIKKENKAITV
jgi:hypothetical protein